MKIYFSGFYVLGRIINYENVTSANLHIAVLGIEIAFTCKRYSGGFRY